MAASIDFMTFGTGEYYWLLPPFAAMMGKHWPESKITLYGDKEPGEVPRNMGFIRIPFRWDWQVNFGQGMQWAFGQSKADVVFVTLLDMLPFNRVDDGAIHDLADYLVARGMVRVRIGHDLNLAKHAMLLEKWRGIDIYTCGHDDRNVGLEAGFMLVPSLWNRKRALKHMMDASIWEWEPVNTVAYRVVGGVPNAWVQDKVYEYQHMHSRQTPGKLYVYLMGLEDQRLVAGSLGHCAKHDEALATITVSRNSKGKPEVEVPLVTLPAKKQPPQGYAVVRYVGRRKNKFLIYGRATGAKYEFDGHGSVATMAISDLDQLRHIGRGKEFKTI